MLGVSAIAVYVIYALVMLSFGHWLVPAISPVLPRPEGVPASAQAQFDNKGGVEWLDCVEVAGGRVTARWWNRKGRFRDIIVRPGARCGETDHLLLGRSLILEADGGMSVYLDSGGGACGRVRREGPGEFMVLVREARANHSFGPAGDARADGFVALPATVWAHPADDGASSGSRCDLVPRPAA